MSKKNEILAKCYLFEEKKISKSKNLNFHSRKIFFSSLKNVIIKKKFSKIIQNTENNQNFFKKTYIHFPVFIIDIILKTEKGHLVETRRDKFTFYSKKIVNLGYNRACFGFLKKHLFNHFFNKYKINFNKIAKIIYSVGN
ncbi:hypothetical protein BpHYR1_047205 [Brachionus plicatilis]|uniref:Uncharacterized protein n=1 Tax=Brachionus plicatilis TaxID=10195 RepID=A0A3M7QFB2_BRAPC|nr:hypothetical protein BpHYR1_047205 [Brachionus plicatilis]